VALSSRKSHLRGQPETATCTVELLLRPVALAKRLPSRGQVSGPITLSAYLIHQDRTFLSDPTLFAAVAFHVSQVICWQIDQLRSAGQPILLFVDEPALCAPSANAVSEETRLSALAATLEDARVRGAHAGLHCCAACPFERMLRAKPHVLSFDAHERLESFFPIRILATLCIGAELLPMELSLHGWG